MQGIHVRRVLLLVGLVIALAVFGGSPLVRGWLAWLLGELRPIVANHPLVGGVLFVLYAALGAMLAFVSSSVLVPVAITAWGQVAAFMLLWAGWIVGGFLSYVIGKYLGRPVVSWLVSSDKVAQYEERIRGEARFPLVFLFQIALPSEIPGYVLGLIRYPMPNYLLILALAELPYAAAVVFLGGALIRGQMVPFALVAIVGLLFPLFAINLLHSRLRPIGKPDPTGSQPGR